MKTTTLRPEVIARVNQLAGPFVEDVNIVVLGLLDYWIKAHETSHSKAGEQMSASAQSINIYDGLPVGLKLKGKCRNREFHAVVEESGIRLLENGKLCTSVSRAAIDLKRDFLGMSENSASTNGWTFWCYRDDATGRWSEIDDFRKN